MSEPANVKTLSQRQRAAKRYRDYWARQRQLDPDRLRARKRASARRARAESIRILGGKCENCDEHDVAGLVITGQHGKSQSEVYTWLRAEPNEAREQLRLLCGTCRQRCRTESAR